MPRIGSEASLEVEFIQPILVSIGWKLKYQTFLAGRKPDYALFLSDEAFDAALNAGTHTPQFWDYATVVADAKAWEKSLDHPLTIDGKREYPPQQIETYLEWSHRDFAILTNGKSVWPRCSWLLPR